MRVAQYLFRAHLRVCVCALIGIVFSVRATYRRWVQFVSRLTWPTLQCFTPSHSMSVVHDRAGIFVCSHSLSFDHANFFFFFADTTFKFCCWCTTLRFKFLFSFFLPRCVRVFAAAMRNIRTCFSCRLFAELNLIWVASEDGWKVCFSFPCGMWFLVTLRLLFTAHFYNFVPFPCFHVRAFISCSFFLLSFLLLFFSYFLQQLHSFHYTFKSLFNLAFSFFLNVNLKQTTM